MRMHQDFKIHKEDTSGRPEQLGDRDVRTAGVGRPELLGPGRVLALQRLLGNASTAQLLADRSRPVPVVQRGDGNDGSGDGGTDESETEESENEGAATTEPPIVSTLVGALKVDRPSARRLVDVAERFGVPAMTNLNQALGAGGAFVWRSPVASRALLAFVEAVPSPDNYPAAVGAVAKAKGNARRLVGILGLLKAFPAHHGTVLGLLDCLAGDLRATFQAARLLALIDFAEPSTRFLCGLDSAVAADTIRWLGHVAGRDKIRLSGLLDALADRADHLSEVRALIDAAGAANDGYRATLGLADAASFASGLVALLVGMGPAASELSSWVEKVAGGVVGGARGVADLLVTHEGHLPELRRIVEHVEGDPGLASPILEVLAGSSYQERTVDLFVALAAAEAAEVARWVRTAGAPCWEGILELVGTHRDHLLVVRRIVDLVGGDPTLAAPALDLVAASGYEARTADLLVALGPAEAIDTVGWVMTTTAGDAPRRGTLVDLLVAHGENVTAVRKVVDQTGGDPSAAAPKLARLSKFGYSEELMGTARGIGENQASATFDDTMKGLTSALPGVSKAQAKKGVRRTDFSLKKDKFGGAVKLDLTALETTSPEFGRLGRGTPQRAYVEGKGTAEAARTEQADRVADSLASVASMRVGGESVVKNLGPEALGALFVATRGDSVRSGAIAKVAVLAGPRGAALAKELLTERLEVASYCKDLLEAGAPGEDALDAARFLARRPDPAGIAWLLSEATSGLADAVAFLRAHEEDIAQVAVVGKALGTGAEATDLAGSKAVVQASPTEVAWLVGQKGAVGFGALVLVVRNREPNLAELHKLVDAGAAKGFAVPVVVGWTANHQLDRVSEAVGEADPSCPTFVALYLRFLVTKGSALASAARAEALLSDASRPATVRIGAASVFYAGGNKAQFSKGRTGPRTGFLVLSFPGADEDLHTHWYTSEKLLTSLHVKRGNAKGTELNEWGPDFPALITRVLELHGLAGVKYQNGMPDD